MGASGRDESSGLRSWGAKKNIEPLIRRFKRVRGRAGAASRSGERRRKNNEPALGRQVVKGTLIVSFLQLRGESHGVRAEAGDRPALWHRDGSDAFTLAFKQHRFTFSIIPAQDLGAIPPLFAEPGSGKGSGRHGGSAELSRGSSRGLWVRPSRRHRGRAVPGARGFFFRSAGDQPPGGPSSCASCSPPPLGLVVGLFALAVLIMQAYKRSRSPPSERR